MADVSIKISSDKLQEFVSNGVEVVNLKLVRSADDLEDESVSFPPEMTHQFFGEMESIFGYKDLQVNLYYSAARLTTCLRLEYSQKVNKAEFDGLEPDNVLQVIAEKLQPGFLSSLDQFRKRLQNDKTFKPMGAKVHDFTTVPSQDHSKKCGPSRKLEIYHCDATTPGFVDYHERMQTFLLFFIDAASFIDLHDEKWTFFVVYEKYKNSEGNNSWAFVGYATLYHYYAHPDRIRARISQFLILPPFQGEGVGVELLGSVYNHYKGRNNVQDLTVEDPSVEFTRMRDFVDARNCSKLPSYHPANLRKGFSDLMASEAREQLKLNKKQARKIYEILRLRATDCHNDKEYKAYRLDVKNRLNAPFKRKDTAKLEKLFEPGEIQDALAAAGVLGKEQRIELLEKMYKEAKEEYEHILTKLGQAHI